MLSLRSCNGCGSIAVPIEVAVKKSVGFDIGDEHLGVGV
jgi:hypothetical protein